MVRATQAIPTPGTTVLQDEPYAAVVSDTYRNVCCAACLHVCTTQIFVCGGCSITFYCSSECVARDGALVHTGTECQALKKLGAMGVEGDSQAMRLALRLVRFLRGLVHVLSGLKWGERGSKGGEVEMA